MAAFFLSPASRAKRVCDPGMARCLYTARFTLGYCMERFQRSNARPP